MLKVQVSGQRWPPAQERKPHRGQEEPGPRQHRGELGSAQGMSTQLPGTERPAYSQCPQTVISKQERRGSPQRGASQMAGNGRVWQPTRGGGEGCMEKLGFCLGAQQPRIPLPHQVLPSHPGADAVRGPPGSLPTHRQGGFRAPGSSRRDKIQVVSRMTDCEGPGALP